MIPFLKRYLGNIWIPILWTVIITILLTLPGSVLPNETKFQIPQFDKFVHISMFGGFVCFWNLYLSNRPLNTPKRLLRLFFYVFFLACAFGVASEYVQKYFIPMRDYDEADIIADMIGAGLAYGLSNILLIEV